MAKKRFNTGMGWGRCGHRYCSDCQTRRGNNRGNRRIRHLVKTVLRRGAEVRP